MNFRPDARRILSHSYRKADERYSPTKKSYDIDRKDYFWNRNASSPFPQVAGKQHYKEGTHADVGLTRVFFRGY